MSLFLRYNNLYGYSSGIYPNYETQQCYNNQSANDDSTCFVKTCEQAVGMQNNSECQLFMSKIKCIYNGNGSCVDPKTATCQSFTGDSTFCENLIIKDYGIRYCFGTGGTCKQRECTDNITALNDNVCEMFMNGCNFTVLNIQLKILLRESR